MKRIMLMGPIAGREDDNLLAFLQARNQLSEAYQGARVIIPHTMVERGCELREQMRVALATMLAWADMVVFLDDWGESDDAMAAWAVAFACGIPIKTMGDVLAEQEA